MTGDRWGLAGVLLCVFAVAVAALGARPLAILTLTAPDRSDPDWYRVRTTSAPRPERPRVVVVGVVTALFAILAALAAGWSASLPAWTLLAVVLAPLAVIDIEHHRLPDRLVLTGYAGGTLLLGVAALVASSWGDLGRAALAGVAVFGIFALAAIAGGIGFGDVKLLGLLAAYLGWSSWTDVVTGIFLGFVLGALEALVLIASRQAQLRSAIAFGPALMLGTLLIGAFG